MNMNPGQIPTYKSLSPVLKNQTTSDLPEGEKPGGCSAEISMPVTKPRHSGIPS